MRPVKDITGRTFGRLTVLALDGAAQSGVRKWKCACECGRIVVVRGDHLRTGNTRSCRCRNSKWADSHIRSSAGATKRPEYQIWYGIIQRCLNPNNRRYPAYGGVGVSICDEWRNSFDAFLAYLGPRPSATHSVDRINPFGNYEPGNVRWATPSVQSANKRSTYAKRMAATQSAPNSSFEGGRA